MLKCNNAVNRSSGAPKLKRRAKRMWIADTLPI